MEKKETNVLGGFETIIDSFIPKTEQELELENFENKVNDDDDDDENKKVEDPIVAKMKKEGKIKTTSEEQDPDKDNDDNDNVVDPKKDEPDENGDEPKNQINLDDNETEMVTNFFDAIAEKLEWADVTDEEKPKNVEDLINYFSKVIEEDSKPQYASEEIEALDNYVKQGGDLAKYLQIDAELDLDEIDLDDETNQKLVVKSLLREKGFNEKQIDKKISKYIDAGLLEDEAQDAIEDLKEIKEQKKEQLLAEQKRAYEQYRQRQQDFCDNVVTEIKNLKNIRGIAIPEKDKKVLMDYILKPDSDGKTKYQKDYAKGGVKNLIESAYFTMNADKLINAAKREGNNTAINKFKDSLKNTTVNSKSRNTSGRDSNSDTIWDSFTRRLRIS
jgi:hypothetical protein